MSKEKGIIDNRLSYIETCLKGMRKIQPKLSQSQDEMFRIYKNNLMSMVRLILKGDCPTCQAYEITKNVPDETKH